MLPLTVFEAVVRGLEGVGLTETVQETEAAGLGDAVAEPQREPVDDPECVPVEAPVTEGERLGDRVKLGDFEYEGLPDPQKEDTGEGDAKEGVGDAVDAAEPPDAEGLVRAEGEGHDAVEVTLDERESVAVEQLLGMSDEEAQRDIVTEPETQLVEEWEGDPELEWEKLCVREPLWDPVLDAEALREPEVQGEGERDMELQWDTVTEPVQQLVEERESVGEAEAELEVVGVAHWELVTEAESQNDAEEQAEGEREMARDAV